MRGHISLWRWQWENLPDKLAMKVAWLLPKRLVMWAYVRVGAHATTGQYGDTIVPELSMMDALQRWDTA